MECLLLDQANLHRTFCSAGSLSMKWLTLTMCRVSLNRKQKLSFSWLGYSTLIKHEQHINMIMFVAYAVDYRNVALLNKNSYKDQADQRPSVPTITLAAWRLTLNATQNQKFSRMYQLWDGCSLYSILNSGKKQCCDRGINVLVISRLWVRPLQ